MTSYAAIQGWSPLLIAAADVIYDGGHITVYLRSGLCVHGARIEKRDPEKQWCRIVQTGYGGRVETFDIRVSEIAAVRETPKIKDGSACTDSLCGGMP